jgi:hypothetical protein
MREWQRKANKIEKIAEKIRDNASPACNINKEYYQKLILHYFIICEIRA